MTRILLLIAILALTGCHQKPAAVQSQNDLGEKIYKSANAPRTAALLPDSSTAWMNANSSIRLKPGFGTSNRDVFLDGEVLFNVQSQGRYPFVVHTRALVVEVSAEPALFKLDSYRHHAGEQLDVFSGQLTARKSYHSVSDSAVESPGAGDMVMINTDIDLMEKEKSDSIDWRSWINGDEQERK